MLRAFAVNRTLMFDAERARLSPPDLMSAHFDLQPAIAARRAASAGSRLLLVQMKRPVVDRGGAAAVSGRTMLAAASSFMISRRFMLAPLSHAARAYRSGLGLWKMLWGGGEDIAFHRR